jgi:hypothetical protein
MYELLLRTETLLMGLDAPVLLAVGAGALVVGLIFWLGGTRYSAAITGLFGAVVGSAIGLLVSQRFGFHPWMAMLVGAVILAVLAILLKKVLILVLAVLVISAVSGAGYVSVVLDRVAPPPEPDAPQQQRMLYQSFSAMEPAARQEYVSRISDDADTFAERLEALLSDTWQAIRPHGWMVVIAIVAGAVVGLLLVWFIAKVVIALAYSVVGTAALFLGVQAALLAVDIHAASGLDPRRWLLPVAFVVLVAIGWVWQLFYSRPARVREVKEAREEPRRR